MAFRVIIRPSAAKVISKLPPKICRQILSRIEGLADDPRPSGCEQLKGEKGFFRIRSGDYRILYIVQDRKLIVVVVRVDHRRDVYRQL
jgi:mRNA interferase RelE/StbE